MSGSFDVKTVIKECLDDLRVQFPSLSETLDKEYTSFDAKAEVERFKILLQPIFMAVIKKDETIFDEPRFFLRKIDFSVLAKGGSVKQKEMIWTYTRMFLVCSYLGADMMETIKGIWTKFTGNTETDEIDSVLNDKKTESGIQDLLETLKDTRLFKLGMEVVENLNVEALGLGEINFSDIEGLIEMVKNPNHPVVQRAMGMVQNTIKQKMQSGNLTQRQIMEEIEMLKEKFRNSLGRVFKTELFGGEPDDEDAIIREQLNSKDPAVRRAARAARLRRKLMNKK